MQDLLGRGALSKAEIVRFSGRSGAGIDALRPAPDDSAALNGIRREFHPPSGRMLETPTSTSSSCLRDSQCRSHWQARLEPLRSALW